MGFEIPDSSQQPPKQQGAQPEGVGGPKKGQPAKAPAAGKGAQKPQDVLGQATPQGPTKPTPATTNATVPILIRPATSEHHFSQTLVMVKQNPSFTKKESYEMKLSDDTIAELYEMEDDGFDIQELFNRLSYMQLFLDAFMEGEEMPLEPFEKALDELFAKTLGTLEKLFGKEAVKELMTKIFPELAEGGKEVKLTPKQQIQFLKEMVKVGGEKFTTQSAELYAELGTLLSDANILGKEGAFKQLLTQQIISMQPGDVVPKEALSQAAAKMIVSIGQNLGAIPDSPHATTASQKYLSGMLALLVSSGAILGTILAEIPRGQLALAGDEAVAAVLAQLHAIKDLGILDEMPFSLFALFAPFQQEQQAGSDEEKEAKQSLSQLIRALIQLILLLAAIHTGGKKMGKDGINILLGECTEQINHYLDNLIFLFKKIDQMYGVNVKLPILHAHSAKGALNHKTYDAFWDQIFLLFSEETPLRDFLDEMDGTEPIAKAVSTLFSPEKEDLHFIPA